MKNLFFMVLLALCIGCTERTESVVGNWRLYYVYGTDSEETEFSYETDSEKDIYRIRPDGTGICVYDEDEAARDEFEWTLTGRKLGIRYCDRGTGYDYYDVELLTADELVLKYTFQSCDFVRYQCYRRVHECADVRPRPRTHTTRTSQ